MILEFFYCLLHFSLSNLAWPHEKLALVSEQAKELILTKSVLFSKSVKGYIFDTDSLGTLSAFKIQVFVDQSLTHGSKLYTAGKLLATKTGFHIVHFFHMFFILAQRLLHISLGMFKSKQQTFI